MVLPSDTLKVLQAFSGGWNYINSTLVNDTTGAVNPGTFGTYPAGISVYAPDGWLDFIIAANETTQPELRPYLTLGQDLDNPTWKLVGQNSLAIGGDIKDIWDVKGDCASGLSGAYVFTSFESTLIERIGVNFTNYFTFYDNCNVHVLREPLGNGLTSYIWFYRLRSRYTDQVPAIGECSGNGGDNNNHGGKGHGYDDKTGYDGKPQGDDKKGKDCKKPGQQGKKY